jgi:predicted Zn-dependent protease
MRGRGLFGGGLLLLAFAARSPSAGAQEPAPIFSAPAPAHSAPASLSDELSALKRASSALNAGDTSGALSALDQYDHVLKGTKMRAEATLLRIETLSRAGQAGAASELAQRFVAQNPESPLVDRARSFVQQ